MNRFQLFLSLFIYAMVGIFLRVYSPYLKFTDMNRWQGFLTLGLFIVGLILLLFLKLKDGDYLPIWKIIIIVPTVVTIFYWLTYAAIK